ncbi:hypothetical protein QEJ31_03695 [Pigmentibacter sp. JX0631]|uniref:tetratricopeptide repeat protein n=1 Tax=Pigmentibacter sp. JX0631 TaxID=2976982 RepID=UPI002468F433|nr:hypothetical protein [Pigmentibacter sp. JX0631]WGL60706.1 hypothetical protein QEJ31_03695 [Pigmentibacter sp. JX0631]
MARQFTTTVNDGLPMWDTFEASFFLAAGLSVGIVFGILFPSLWRTFRRRFRKISHYASNEQKITPNLHPKLKILHESGSFPSDEFLNSEVHLIYQQLKRLIKISEAFVLARNFFQIGNSKEAINIYIEILTNESVSKQETNRALFELSQVYASLGLYLRAFDTAYELYKRDTNNFQVFEHLLHVCTLGHLPDKLLGILNSVRIQSDNKVRLQIAHAISKIAEVQLPEKDKIEKTIDLARTALRWNGHSARAMILLWQATTQDFWSNSSADMKTKWMAFAAVLEALNEIYKSSKISPAAVAKYLAEIILKMSQEKEVIPSYVIVQNEFKSVLQKDKLEINAQKFLWASIFHATLLLEKSPEFQKSKYLDDVLAILGENKGYLASIVQLSEAAKIGYLSHSCARCGAFFSSFAWKCLQCNTEETLKPIILPNFEHS